MFQSRRLTGTHPGRTVLVVRSTRYMGPSFVRARQYSLRLAWILRRGMAGKHQATAQVTDPGILSRTTFELSQLLGALAKEPSKSTIRRTGSGRACLHSFPVPHYICNSHRNAYDRLLRPHLKVSNSIRARNGAARLAEHDTAQGVPSTTSPTPRQAA